MENTIKLKMDDDIVVVVPDNINLITPYVLAEQQDWFEDEIKFVRHLLRSGDNAIDIGANYGLFSLSMAKKAGETGHILAIEPVENTANFLRSSIESNSFRNIHVDQVAVSSSCGSAHISININSELNELLRDGKNSLESQEVALVTLDSLQEKYKWNAIEFLKIDAEGEEKAIIDGGSAFFKDLSPLIQYEVKASTSVNINLVDEFEKIGYKTYRLVPELQILIPFDRSEKVDPYLLNLFCCKQDKADILRARGLLTHINPLDGSQSDRARNMLKALAEDSFSLSMEEKLPFAEELLPFWDWSQPLEFGFTVGDAILLFMSTRSESLSFEEKYSALVYSSWILSIIPTHMLRLPTLLTYSRVKRGLGRRGEAVHALRILLEKINSGADFDIKTPFLASDDRYHNMRVSITELNKWFLCSALESLEKNEFFSSYYSGPESKERLNTIKNIGYGSSEMTRRLNLVSMRFPD